MVSSESSQLILLNTDNAGQPNLPYLSNRWITGAGQAVPDLPKLPEGEQWLYEPKQDGYRVIAVVDGNTTVLHSMSGLNYTAKYPHIAEALKWLKLKEAVFDGEVVALDESGRPSFQELLPRRCGNVFG